MAQAGQSGIVDLTGEDDNDESIARAQAAYEKALAAASRLTNHFESMKTSKPVPYKSPNDHVVPGKKDPFPAIAPKTLVPPRLGTFPNSPRFETNGHKKDEKNNTIPRQDSSVPVRGVWFPQSALGMAASRPGNSPSISERVEGNKRRPKEMTTLTPGAVKSTVRTPRSAAVSAKQNIAETCNKLEEWVNKDPNIIPQQAGVGTPRKPGRLKKDSEEWSPSWDTTNNVEEQKGPRNFISNSPIPSAGMAELRVAEESEESTAHFTDREENLPGSLERSLGKHGGKYGDLKANKGNGLSRIKGISTSLSTKKRKYSGSSQSRDSPVKLARWDKEPSAYHDYTSSSLSDPASGEHIHNGTANSSPAGCFPRCVYPALKAAKAEFKQSITEDELTGIGQGIIDEIVEQGVEAFCPASVNCLENQRTELILKFVSEKFHERAARNRNGLPVNLNASAESPTKDVTVTPFKRYLKASRLERDPSTKNRGTINNEFSLTPSTAKNETNSASTDQADAHSLGRPKSSMLQTQEKIDPRLRHGSREAHGSKTSEPRVSPPSTGHVAFTALFESVVYPAMKKSKKRHKDNLPREELDAIGKIIVNDVLKRLASHSEASNQIDGNLTKKIKHFVKKSFRQKVKKANAQSLHNSATPANDSRLDVAAISSGSSGPEATKEGGSILSGGHRPHTSGLNHTENASSSRVIAVSGKRDAQVLRQPHRVPLDLQQSLSLQTSSNEPPTSPFGPGFDRGRYPALRRRRGNKCYTPDRPSKPTPKLKPSRSRTSDNHLHSRPVTGHSTDPSLTAPASNQHSNVLGLANGKDHVRLLKTLANQITNPRVGEMPLTASITAAKKKRTPTNQKSALELLASIEETTDMRLSAPESANYGDVSRALRLASAQGQGRMTEVDETPAGGRGQAWSQAARSRKTTANDQSAHQNARKRPLDDTDPLKEPRPSFCPKPATALDPSLEHVVAVLVTDTSSWPSKDAQSFHITSTNQMQLVADQSIVKHVDLTSKVAKPNFVRIETKVIDPVRHSGRCISALLRNRELGLSSRGRHLGTMGELRQLKSEMIEPWKNWKGASGDVVAVAWSPDSNVYAFGAAAHTNIEDIQYNRPCNLLLGNLTSNEIRELPDHRVDRPRPETIPSGPNATQAVFDACDPKVYETVTSIAFSPTGDRMFTASHDCTVKIWDISAGKHQCLSTLDHEAWVTSVELSEHRPGLFATASKCVKNAVRIYYDPADPACYENFSASRAEARPEWKIYPECLRWGPSAYNSHLLLAGFQQWEQQEDLVSGGGQLCLWDAHAGESIKVTPSSQSVYAAAWHPTEPFFATGGATGNNIVDKTNTKTVVRTWDFRRPKRCQVEYECPAIDMQDITFSPLNPNIVTAGCTDGISYVWDCRWPHQPLHRLKHGRPLADLDHTREREEADTGVMMSLWGPGGSLFYTGSSDGMIKAWDVRRHPIDALISNVANFDVSIQSGAFSPDGNNILVGDAEGGLHVLSSAPCGPRSSVKSTDAYIDLVRASDGSGLKIDQNDDNPGTEGIEAARSLIESGQLEYHKAFGVGQGLNYHGPYATYARKEADESSIGRLRKKFEKKQPISKRGEKRWDIAIPMTSLLFERKQTLDREKDDSKTAADDPNQHEPKVIQLSKVGETLQPSPFFSTPEAISPIGHPSPTSLVDSLASEKFGAAKVADGNEDQSVEYNTISESEMIEENHWWTRMGEEEIEQARAGRVRY